MPAAQLHSGRIYNIISVHDPGKVVDLTTPTRSYQVIRCEYHGGTNQKWRAELTPEGNWTFKNIDTDRYCYLAVSGDENSSYSNGVKAIGSDYPFEWCVQVENKRKGFHRIRVQEQPSKCLDSSANQGDYFLQIWDCWWPGQNQLWKFEEA